MTRYTWRTFAWEIWMLLLGLAFCLPFYLLVAISLKPSAELFTTSPLAFPSAPRWDNFAVAWNAQAGGGFGPALVSSMVITVGSVLILVFIGSMCAYVLARRPGRMSNALYILFVLGIIIPFQLSVIPLYTAFQPLGLIGSYAGMIILWVGIGSPLAVFLYTGFVRSLPRDYEEAARIDGAGVWRTYWSVVLPLLRPVTGTVAILLGLFIWNDFFVSLIYLGGSDHQTLPVAVYSFVGEYVSQWNFVFAAVILSLIPIVVFFVIAQKQMIKGFAGGLKG
jgi:raffinose/stachyose/melibiose transport system permease protein